MILIALDQVAGEARSSAFTHEILMGGAALALAIAFGPVVKKWAAGQLDKPMERKKK